MTRTFGIVVRVGWSIKRRDRKGEGSLPHRHPPATALGREGCPPRGPLPRRSRHRCQQRWEWKKLHVSGVKGDRCPHSFFFLIFLPFPGPLSLHMEVPRLGVQSELWPPTYATATATWNPSLVCHQHHNSQQCRILNPPSKAKDRTRNLMVPSRIR